MKAGDRFLLVDHSPSITMSAPKSLPFIQELLELNDPTIRKKKAHHMLKDFATVGRNGFDVVKHRVFNWSNCTGTSHVHCIFGQFVNWSQGAKSFDAVHYDEKRYNYGYPPQGFIKNGIEVLHAQPNATGSTHSNKCRITIKELKEACKANGIKATGDKKTLLRTLMKL